MTFEMILDKYRRLCSRREYCSADLRSRILKDAEGDGQLAVEVLEKLEDDKYFDDLRYCTAFARDKAFLAGWGKKKIAYMLAVKGIDKQTIASALEEIEDDKADVRLEKLLAVKYMSLKDDPQWKLKLVRFAMGRGYDYEQVKKIVERMNKQ